MLFLQKTNKYIATYHIMGKILGLDIGTNSIGWAIVDSDKKEIIDMGCKIFEHPIKINKSRKVLEPV